MTEKEAEMIEMKRLMMQFYLQNKDKTLYLWGRKFVFETKDMLREVLEYDPKRCGEYYLPLQNYLHYKRLELQNNQILNSEKTYGN